MAVEILRGCVPIELPEPDRLITDGHQVLVESLDSQKIIDENWQRDLAEVKRFLYQGSILPEMKETQVDPTAIINKPMQRVKWGMHPLGQKLVDDL